MKALVRKHRAPQGVLRRVGADEEVEVGGVARKHRATLGVLGPLHCVTSHEHVDGQLAGAP